MATIELGELGFFPYRNSPTISANRVYVDGEEYASNRVNCKQGVNAVICRDVAKIFSGHGTENIYGTHDKDKIYVYHTPCVVQAGGENDQIFVEPRRSNSPMCSITLWGHHGNDQYHFTRAFEGGCIKVIGYIYEKDGDGRDSILLPSRDYPHNPRQGDYRKKVGTDLELYFHYIKHIWNADTNTSHTLPLTLELKIMDHYHRSGLHKVEEIIDANGRHFNAETYLPLQHDEH